MSSVISSTDRALRRIVICGTRYSDNLGDGIIAESMVKMIHQHDPMIEVVELDISGRMHYAEAGGPRKMAMQRVMFAAPPILRPLIVAAALAVTRPVKLQPRWRQSLRGADLLIIGGGQLLQDEYLNFPIKISGIVAEAGRQNISTAIFSCGVGQKWSYTARWLLRRAFCNPNVFYQSARDKESMCYLDAHLIGLHRKPTRWAPDPALWSAKAYGTVPETHGTPRIGLGVAHPLVLKNTSEQPDSFCMTTITKFWLDLIKELDRRKHHLVLFTNGSEEDSKFLQMIAVHIDGLELVRKPEVLTRPRSALELVQQIARLNALVAHRLHANIVAFALGIPSVGLIWDSKVRGFFNLSGRSNWSVEAKDSNAAHVANQLETALRTGVDREKRATLESAAYSSLDELLTIARDVIGTNGACRTGTLTSAAGLNGR